MQVTEPRVKERPILFSAEMVRAILENRKSQTRRVVKLPRGFDINHYPRDGCGLDGVGINADFMLDLQIQTAVDDCDVHLFPCPYGIPGDRLWVRETWMPLWHSGGRSYTCLCPTGHQDKPDVIKYRADGEAPHNFGADWRPSIHMPRRHSRITLEITNVRAERLQDISEEDAKAEGVVNNGPFDCRPGHVHREMFCELWNKISGAGSWESNPWVWAISFRRIEK